MRIRTLLPVLIVLLVVLDAVYYRFMQTAPESTPDISLISTAGEELRLSTYRGRPLLITFWSTTCSSCVREIPHLLELYRELGPRGLEIIGIAMAYDRPDRVLAMQKSRGITYPVALDIHAEAARAFGDVQLTPNSFLIGPDGRITRHQTGSLDIAQLRREILAMIPQQQSSPAETIQPSS